MSLVAGLGWLLTLPNYNVLPFPCLMKRSKNFSPTNGQKWCADEPKLDNFSIGKMKVWNFERLSAYQFLRIQVVLNCGNIQQILNKSICSAMSSMIRKYYSLKPFVPKDDMEVFIEYGFALTKLQSHVIDEPLAIMMAWDWLDKMGHFSLLHCLQCDISRHALWKKGFEAYLAFYV